MNECQKALLFDICNKVLALKPKNLTFKAILKIAVQDQ